MDDFDKNIKKIKISRMNIVDKCIYNSVTYSNIYYFENNNIVIYTNVENKIDFVIDKRLQQLYCGRNLYFFLTSYNSDNNKRDEILNNLLNKINEFLNLNLINVKLLRFAKENEFETLLILKGIKNV